MSENKSGIDLGPDSVVHGNRLSDERIRNLIDKVFSRITDTAIDMVAEDIIEAIDPLKMLVPYCRDHCQDDCPFNDSMYLQGDDLDGDSEAFNLCDVLTEISKRVSYRLENENEEVPEENQKPVLRIHDVKSWPQWFHPVFLGKKDWEYRLNDRGYRVGDLFIMREWVPGIAPIDLDSIISFTGKWILAEITSVHGGIPGLPEEYRILNLFVTEVGSNFKELSNTLDGIGDYEIVQPK